MPGDNRFEQDIFKAAEAVARDVGLQPGFLLRVRDEDDWSFVIKVHALIEAATTNLLAHHLDDPRLGNHLRALTLAGRHAKLELAKSLSLVGDEDIVFARWLGELRNSLVHDISKVSFGFDGYITKIPRSKVDEFVRAVGPAFVPETEINGKRVTGRELVLENPKVAVWLCGIGYLGAVHLGKAHSELDKLKAKSRAFEEVFSQWRAGRVSGLWRG